MAIVLNGQTNDVTINGVSVATYVVDTVEELALIEGSVEPDTVIVKDLNRGGTFIWSDTGTANGGTVFAGVSGYWNRQYSGAVNIKWFGAKCDATTDDTTAINKAILYAYTVKKISDYVTVEFPSGSHISIVLGTIILPSGIDLNLNGCTLYGEVASGNIAYNPSGIDMIVTGYVSSGILVSNKGSALNSHRVINTKIRNGKIANVNSALYLTNFNEGCRVEDINYVNVSRATTMIACFYSKYYRSVARESAQYASGQILHHLTGGDNNLMEFDSISGANAAITFAINGGSNFSLAFNNCSFEEGKNTLSSIGILIGEDCYVSGLSIDNAYVEGVRYGLIVYDGGAVYCGSFNNSIFNNNEYSVYTASANQLRAFDFLNNAVPDNGGTDRNLVLIADGNDVITKRPTIYASKATGTKALLGNFSNGIGSYDLAESIWLNNDGTLASRSKSHSGSKDGILSLPFEGRACNTRTNEVPYCTLSRNGDKNKISTFIQHDTSNILAFTFEGNSSNVNWVVKGFIFGSLVFYTAQSSGTTVEVKTTSGSPVVGENIIIEITQNGNGFGAVVNTKGIIRHI